jgi:multidrug efflux pump subunit AcrA (membrane-fusion protein)
MMVRGALVLGICLLASASAWAQALPTAATIESIQLELTMPENYLVSSVLEPIRRVALVAPADGTIRSLEVPLGAAVRSTQEIAQFDRTEATAWVKMAHAEVLEKKAQLKSSGGNAEVASAQLEAAEARAEIAQLALDRLTLRAPFAGRIVALHMSSGQYVLKGTVIAELADVTGLKSLVPVDRRTASEGRDLKIYVEEQEQIGKVQSILPLPEAYAHLRELAAPFAAAWVDVRNDKGELAPGLRVRSATLPVTPLATIPKEAVKTLASESPGTSAVKIAQVIRGEYVTNVTVEILGKVGPERIQVTGAFRPTDALIVSSSVPLLPGTLVRFSQLPSRGIEGTTPNPANQGVEAGITPPGRVQGTAVPPGSVGTNPLSPTGGPRPAPRRSTNPAAAPKSAESPPY